MNGVTIILIRQASEMKHLYGSVRSADIAQGLDDVGYKISRSQVQINTPIKTLGMHEVHIVLHPEVLANIQVNVAQSVEEAAVQAAAQAKAQQTEAAVPANEFVAIPENA
jgi:large subunit ribosomal protein L9